MRPSFWEVQFIFSHCVFLVLSVLGLGWDWDGAGMLAKGQEKGQGQEYWAHCFFWSFCPQGLPSSLAQQRNVVWWVPDKDAGKPLPSIGLSQ
jgi:hypothetical protein